MKPCESVLIFNKTILDFIHSVDRYKGESEHVLLFGQLLAEMYEANVIVFIGELRNIIETDCRMSILSHLDKAQNANAIRIPYAKIKSVISKFVLRNSVDNSVELLMEQLKTRYPTVC